MKRKFVEFVPRKSDNSHALNTNRQSARYAQNTKEDDSVQSAKNAKKTRKTTKYHTIAHHGTLHEEPSNSPKKERNANKKKENNKVGRDILESDESRRDEVKF